MQAAVHCEFYIWNIQIFPKYLNFLDQQKKLVLILRATFNWSPLTLCNTNCLFIHIEHSCTLTSFALPPTCNLALWCKPGRRENVNQIVWNQLVLDRFSIDITCHKKLLLLFIASAGLDLSCHRMQILPALFSSPVSMSL